MCRSRWLKSTLSAFWSCFKETYGVLHGKEKLCQVEVSFSFCACVSKFAVPSLYLKFEMPLLDTVCILLVIFMFPAVRKGLVLAFKHYVNTSTKLR